MNYIQLITQFWKTRRKKRITSLQADLYLFLVQECNEQDWENPFQCPNGRICTTIGITEKSVIDARNRLKQLGLIQFESGVTKSKSPVYYLLDYWNKVSNPVSIPVSIGVSNEGGNEVYTIKNKQNKTKPKQNQNSFSVPPSAATGGKKKNESFPHWKILVENWFSFYKEKFQQEPSFTGPMAASLKSIVDRLKKFSSEKGFEWTEEYSAKVFKHFLTKAYADEWLRNNFLLTNLSTKFDSIINSSIDGTTKTAKQPTGGAVNTASAFAKIDKLVSASGDS